MSSSFSNNRTQQLVSASPLAFIDRILRYVELTPTQFAKAEKSYEAVTQILAKAGMPVQPYSPFMFTQGSMRLGTTVRPIGQDEHDLDIVCMLRRGGVWLTARQAYELVWETLGNDGTYRAMRRKWKRCIRLVYAGDFHLDIVTAVPEQAAENGPLYVSDRELSAWFSSHPVGIADWFFKNAEILPMLIRTFSAANEGTVIAKAEAKIEPMPEYSFEKTPLQRISS